MYYGRGNITGSLIGLLTTSLWRRPLQTLVAIAFAYAYVVLTWPAGYTSNQPKPSTPPVPIEVQQPAPAVPSNTITGPARVIDGDTVDVGLTRVRLKGVDVAEMNTERGRHARQVMLQIVGSSELTCELTGEKTYGREVGYCTTAEGVDIGAAIVGQGAALACPRYSTRYVVFETAAAVAAQKRATYCVRR